MRPERMYRLTLLCRNEDALAVIDRLAELKAVHVTDHQKEVIGNFTVDIGKPLLHAEELSAGLTSTRSLLTKLPKSETGTTTNPELVARLRIVQDIAAAFSKQEEALATLEREQQLIATQDAVIALLPKDMMIEGLAPSRTVEAMLLQTTTKSDQTAIAKTEPLLIAPNDEHNTVLLAVPKHQAAKAKDLLVAAAFTPIDLSPLSGMKGTPQQATARVQERRVQIAKEQAAAREAITQLAKQRQFLEQSEQVLQLALLKAQAPLHFGATKSLTLIRGFIPVSAQQLNLPQPTVVELVPADDAPTLLANPRTQSFEALINLYSLPRYNELDPTNLLAFTFPLFFGFMLGDIGYGLCALALFLVLKYKVPATRQLANILIISALSTIAFGVLYGEFFGAEQIFLLHLHPVLHRADSVMMMFCIALLIALFHVNLGLILGMINESRHGVMQAIGKKASWMLLQVAFLLLLLCFKDRISIIQDVPYLSQMNIDLPIALIVLAIALGGIQYFEGGFALIETLSILSNIMSYARLMAVGLASVYLALVVNDIGIGMFAKGGVWIAVGVLVLLIGHTINLLLGLLGPFLHSLRLHYVEFFTKFYEGGGKPYRPFGAEVAV